MDNLSKSKLDGKNLLRLCRRGSTQELSVDSCDEREREGSRINNNLKQGSFLDENINDEKVRVVTECVV